MKINSHDIRIRECGTIIFGDCGSRRSDETDDGAWFGYYDDKCCNSETDICSWMKLHCKL